LFMSEADGAKMGLPPARTRWLEALWVIPGSRRRLSRFLRVYGSKAEKSGTVHHEPYGSPINDEILPKQGRNLWAGSYRTPSGCMI